MPKAFTIVEVLVTVAIVGLLVGDWPTAPAFTLVEVLAAGAILFVIGGLIWAYFDARAKTKTVTKGRWLNTPPSIPAAPASATLVYLVYRENLKGTFMGNVPGHSVTFTLAQVGPSGSIIIESTTDAIGNVNPVGGLTGTGVTDASGRITVIIQFEQFRSGALTAADTASGKSDPSDTFVTTAY